MRDASLVTRQASLLMGAPFGWQTVFYCLSYYSGEQLCKVATQRCVCGLDAANGQTIFVLRKETLFDESPA
jgi:hypothetical protein